MRLNEFLQPIDSPITRYTGDSSYLFNSETQRGSFVSERLFGQAVIPSIAIKDASITDAKIDTVSASKISAGTIFVGINVGEEKIRIDGVNVCLIVEDEDNDDRVLLGKFP